MTVSKVTSILCRFALLACVTIGILAPGARAAEFTIELKPALLAGLTGVIEGQGFFLNPAANYKIICAKESIEAGSEILNAKEGRLILGFAECQLTTHDSGKKLTCSPGDFKITARVLPVEHGESKYILMEPETGALFTRFPLVGEECSIPEEETLPILGTIAAKITNNDALVMLAESSQPIQELLKTSLIFLGKSYWATKFTLELTGMHTGLRLGVA